MLLSAGTSGKDNDPVRDAVVGAVVADDDFRLVAPLPPDDYAAVVDEDFVVQMIGAFAQQDRAAAGTARRVAGVLQGLGIIGVVVRTAAELLDRSERLDVRNAPLDADRGPVGEPRPPVGPHHVGRRASCLILGRPRRNGLGCSTFLPSHVTAKTQSQHAATHEQRSATRRG